MIKHTLIADKTYWVGKIDDRKVPFHRLTLEKGTTYNSYLLYTEKPTLIDTVDILYGREFVEKLQETIGLDKLEYVVINHVEPDHAGALPVVMSKAKNAKIVTTSKGKEFLSDMFKLHSREFIVIHDGDTLDIGGKTLQFFETPYLHTEETMVTYCIEDKILYPCDQFSTHIANYELFNDLAKEDITEDFKVYYQLIMYPHRPYVQDMLKKIRNINIDMIAPSHGYILRKDAEKYIALYDEMSKLDPNSPSKKALILYSSMTGNTGKIAQYITHGLQDYNVVVDVVNVKNAEMNGVLQMAQEADLLLFGSSTRYGDMIGNLEEFLKEITKLDLNKKLGTAFGSFGWSGEAIEVIYDYLKQSNIKVVDTSMLIKSTGDDHVQMPLRVNFAPKDAAKDLCIHAGRVLGELLVH